ncbi:MAG: inositol monophosphatase [Alphaproteobacteria bacterium]|nr:inositol monophosphatase [Alphaproteobacteria bacterium]
MPVSRAEAHAIAAMLGEVAVAELKPRFRRLAAGQVRTKTGPHDFVTDADEAAERALVGGFSRLLPGVPVIGEEAASADPGLLARIAGAERVLVVDPLDGTANFAAGLPLYCVMAALVERGAVVAAWIHDPVRADTAIALKGEGAWLADSHGHERPLRVAAPVAPSLMVAATSVRFLPPRLRALVGSRAGRIGNLVNLRCAGHEYRLLAEGHAHAVMYWRLLPWDHAPGSLIAAEAGACVRRFNGEAYDPTVHGGGLLVAPDAASWQALRDALIGPAGDAILRRAAALPAPHPR